MTSIVRNTSILAVVCLAGTGLTYFERSAYAQEHSQITITGKARVVDGDTFHVTDENNVETKIRVWGYDAPGARDRNQPESVKAYSAQAKRYMQRLSSQGVSCGKNRGRSHDRAVKQCWTKDQQFDLAAEMVRAGYGVDWTKFSKGKYADEEAEARAAKRGVWQTINESWIR